jgi:CubicO group peptidase (beta-lactamase class C family)
MHSGCSPSDPVYIVPPGGYEWPSADRSYWPTQEWQTAEMEAHGIDPQKMSAAADFARNDHLARALLVVKNGYIVFEEYYDECNADFSSNLWSVTKSVTNALVGMLIDDDLINSPDQLMAELMPAYPEFKDITLHHTLTMSTGLRWVEEGPLWVDWVFSPDWVAAALARGQERPAGEAFFYSSGNSHFLTALVNHCTGYPPGKLAKERLFDPLGIPFDTLPEPIYYNNWYEYTERLVQTWRKDPKGIECASFALYLTARDMAKFGYLYLNRGFWDGEQIISEDWVRNSTKDHMTNIYGRYSYGYQWYLSFVGGRPAFLASGYGGQIIGVVPSLDLVVVLKYEAEIPEHPESGTVHDDMWLFDLVVQAVSN